MGCMGHGVSLTTMNGRTIAEMITGKQTERTQMFFVGRKVFPWPTDLIAFGVGHAIRGFMRLEDKFYYR